jgi:hypothetical protein
VLSHPLSFLIAFSVLDVRTLFHFISPRRRMMTWHRAKWLNDNGNRASMLSPFRFLIPGNHFDGQLAGARGEAFWMGGDLSNSYLGHFLAVGMREGRFLEIRKMTVNYECECEKVFVAGKFSIVKDFFKLLAK